MSFTSGVNGNRPSPCHRSRQSSSDRYEARGASGFASIISHAASLTETSAIPGGPARHFCGRDADVQLPGVRLERHAAQRGHGIHQRHRAVRPRDRANRRAVVQRSRRCLRMDHGHQLNSRVRVEVVSHCSRVDHVVVRDLQLGHIGAQRLEPGAHALAEDPGRQVQHPHPGAYERAGRRLQAEDGLALQQDDFVLRRNSCPTFASVRRKASRKTGS